MPCYYYYIYAIYAAQAARWNTTSPSERPSPSMVMVSASPSYITVSVSEAMVSFTTPSSTVYVPLELTESIMAMN